MINIKKYSKFLLVLVAALSMTADSFAALTVTKDDYVTKEEVDKAIAAINEKLSFYEENLTENLDAILSVYKPIGYIEMGDDPNGIYEGTWVEIPDKIVVETKNYSDSSGYMLYSDGWCEQWGLGDVNQPSTPNVSQTVNLHIPYVDSNYVAITTFQTRSAGPDTNATFSVDNKTATSFIAKRFGGSLLFFRWHTWGQTNKKTKVWQRIK